MTIEENYGLVVLASGLSQRFGQSDKLLVPFRGQALAAASADLAIETRCSARICVLKPNCPELEKIYSSRDIEPVINDRPEDGQGHSLSLGIKAIADRGCHSAYVVLADMPFVTTAHLKLLHTEIGECDAAISFDGERRSPPALFRQTMFQRLIDQDGDSGARDVLRISDSVKQVTMPPGILFDIDTPEDLKRLSDECQG